MTYTVVIDTNSTSNTIGSYNDIEEAKRVALENLEDTNVENDSEGINIYTEEGLIMSFQNGSDEITLLDPNTSMQIGIEKIK